MRITFLKNFIRYNVNNVKQILVFIVFTLQTAYEGIWIKILHLKSTQLLDLLETTCFVFL